MKTISNSNRIYLEKKNLGFNLSATISVTDQDLVGSRTFWLLGYETIRFCIHMDPFSTYLCRNRQLYRAKKYATIFTKSSGSTGNK
jgi:hypothetical protein